MATRRIPEQRRAGAARDAAGASSRLRVSGRSARHLKRWYREVTEPFPSGPPHVNVSSHVHSVAAPDTPERDKRDANARSDEPDALDDSAGVLGDDDGGAARLAAFSGERFSQPRLSPPAPVAIVVEDTEGFDARVLGDLLLALSDASDELPVTVLLGVATSANTVHGMLPASTAARLDARAFKLYSPKNVMAAVQTRVLMDPGRVPALSNAALELLATRFKEHDFSLSAARRAVHLLTLEHFMYQPLAALAPAAAAAAEAAAEAERAERAEHRRRVHDSVHERRDRDRDRDPDGAKIDSGKEPDSAEEEEALFCLEDVARVVARDDETTNAADSAVDAAVVDALAARARVAASAAEAAEAAAESAADTWLTPKSLQWAKKHLGLGTREEVTRALRDAFPARKRWGLALRCVSAAAAACGVQKGELAELFVDASSAKFWTTDASQGQSLLRLICARLERDDTSVLRVRALCRRWARLVALEPTTHDERGGDLRKIAALCDEALAAATPGPAAAAADGDPDRDRDRDPEQHPEEHPEREKDAAARDVAEGEKAGDVAEEGGEGEDPETLAATPAPAKKNKNATFVSPRPPSSRARRRGGAAATPARVSTPAGVSADAPTDAVAEHALDLTSPDGARAVAAALVARRRAGPERARALELAAAARGKRRREDRDVSSRDCVSEKDSARTAGDADATETTAPSTEKEFSRAARRAACAFLRAVAGAHASRPPCSLPGMELFCVTSTSRLREAVQAAPRLVLEQQMANPQPFLKCGCCPPGGGASATLPDCCAAYTLLQDAGDAANVHEWFRAFCEMHAGSVGTKAKNVRSKGRGDGRGARRGPPPEAPADEPRDDDDDDDDEGGEGGEPRRNGKETFSLEKRKLWELQARFTRAAAELEFLGVARPVKRRKVEYMQRTAFPLDQLLGDDDR